VYKRQLPIVGSGEDFMVAIFGAGMIGVVSVVCLGRLPGVDGGEGGRPIEGCAYAPGVRPIFSLGFRNILSSLHPCTISIRKLYLVRGNKTSISREGKVVHAKTLTMTQRVSSSIHIQYSDRLKRSANA